MLVAVAVALVQQQAPVELVGVVTEQPKLAE
jgi:hypothetical protein